MSKITKREFDRKYDAARSCTDMREQLWGLFNQRESEFAELVEAAVAMDKAKPNATKNNWDKLWGDLTKAVKPFLPPPSLADRLDALAESGDITWHRVQRELRAIAAELRDGEK